METTDYCSYELSKALKACGFDEPCDHYYAYDEESKIKHLLISASPSEWDWNYSELPEFVHPECSAPHIYHAQKWLREKKKMHCQVLLNGVRSMYFWQVREMIGNGRHADSTRQYDMYEDAMSDCISAALELINKGE